MDKRKWIPRLVIIFIIYAGIQYGLSEIKHQKSLDTLPYQRLEFTDHDLTFSIAVPQDWLIFQTPGGNHGNSDSIANGSPRGRIQPFLTIDAKKMTHGGIQEALQWHWQNLVKEGILLSSENELKSGPDFYSGNFTYQRDTIFGGEEILCGVNLYLHKEIGVIVQLCDTPGSWEKNESYYLVVLNSIKVE